jgi:REP element-mobilizing transposase RayT
LEKLKNTKKKLKNMQPLCPNTCYHIFNHSNGFENVFLEDKNFWYFLEKYNKYIVPIAETYSYCLMPNHFHLVVRIRKWEVIKQLINNSNSENIDDNKIEKFLSKQFANLFSSYTQAFNKIYNRKGSLFIKNFKRQIIDNKQQFINTIVYTHRNPIHHGFCENYEDWKYTSYNAILGQESEIVETKKVIDTFGDLLIFIEQHQKGIEKFNQTTELEI